MVHLKETNFTHIFRYMANVFLVNLYLNIREQNDVTLVKPVKNEEIKFFLIVNLVPI